MKQVFRDMRRLAVRLANRNMPVESTRLLALTVRISLVPQLATIRELRWKLPVILGALTEPNLQDDLCVILGQLRRLESTFTV